MKRSKKPPSPICPRMHMIVVGVNGANSLGGSFYVNSPVTGNWEDYLVNDVITYIDTNYRTLAKSSGRGLPCGHGTGDSKTLMEQPLLRTWSWLNPIPPSPKWNRPKKIWPSKKSGRVGMAIFKQRWITI